MWVSLRLLQWIICSQHSKIRNAHWQMPGVTINSKLWTTSCLVNDCLWYRLVSYSAWATYMQDCTFMKYTCTLWKQGSKCTKKKKREMGILYRLREEREKAIGFGQAAEQRKRRCRTVGPWCSAVLRISIPTRSRNLPLVVYDTYIFKNIYAFILVH